MEYLYQLTKFSSMRNHKNAKNKKYVSNVNLAPNMLIIPNCSNYSRSNFLSAPTHRSDRTQLHCYTQNTRECDHLLSKSNSATAPSGLFQQF